MSKTETILIERNEAREKSGLERLLKVFGLTLVWGFIAADVVGSLAAALWTVIPTELLSWGADKVNLIGYVSHCPFVPASTSILLVAAGIGSFIAYRLKWGRTIGLGVFVGTTGGLLVGLLGGFDVTMFIGMGAGIGLGILLGLIIGLVGKLEVLM